MTYWRILWTDDSGQHISDPIEKWTDAETYRRQIGGNAVAVRY